MAESEGEPTMCSKFNVTFPTESEYQKHYDEKHRQQERS